MNMAKPKTVTIRFIRDSHPKEGGGYKQNQTVELSEDSALRWIRRGAAEQTTADKAAPSKQKTKETK